jgi:hypothetical protein
MTLRRQVTRRKEEIASARSFASTPCVAAPLPTPSRFAAPIPAAEERKPPLPLPLTRPASWRVSRREATVS